MVSHILYELSIGKTRMRDIPLHFPILHSSSFLPLPLPPPLSFYPHSPPPRFLANAPVFPPYPFPPFGLALPFIAAKRPPQIQLVA